MAGTLLKGGIALAAVTAVIFQLFLKDFVWMAFGIGQVLQPISDFQYTCRRIQDPRLQGCEDLWLSETTRQLFLACSDPNSRRDWAPAMHHLNAAKRGKNDAVIAMDIDSPKGDSFVYRVLSTPRFSGVNGDGKLNLVGFGGIDIPASASEDDGARITIGLVNMRPSVDPETGSLLDNSRTGANGTIEIFEAGPAAKELKHVRTIMDPRIVTPNRVAFAGDDADAGFYVTNDHGQQKTGLKSRSGIFAGVGDVTFCDASGCSVVAGGLRFPNGLFLSRTDGLLYVPTTSGGEVFVYKPSQASAATGSRPPLKEVARIPVGYAIDNLYVDAKGDIYAATFSRAIEVPWSFTDPMNKWPRSTIIRIRRNETAKATADEESSYAYTTEKILEDRDKEALPGSTSLVHDAKTGRLFLSGVASPFIAVCDPK